MEKPCGRSVGVGAEGEGEGMLRIRQQQIQYKNSNHSIICGSARLPAWERGSARGKREGERKRERRETGKAEQQGALGEKRAKRQKVESIWQLDFTTK